MQTTLIRTTTTDRNGNIVERIRAVPTATRPEGAPNRAERIQELPESARRFIADRAANQYARAAAAR